MFGNGDIRETRLGRGETSFVNNIPRATTDQRYEETDIHEDPDELDTYHRNMLMYQGPDPELFESDAPRRNTHSTEIMNIRHHGARSELVPHHPEIFLEHTDKDPRGTATGPDMRKMVDQQRFRGRYIKFYKDGDESIPESHRSRQMVARDKDKLFYQTKNRLKIFDTSMDGRHNGGPTGIRKGQDITKITLDGPLKDLNHGRKHIHRGDKTTILSNYTPIGWYKTTDHKFAVAQYGKQYSSMHAGDIDLRRINSSVHLDHSEMVMHRDVVTSKALVQTMKRLATERSQGLPAHFQLSLQEKVRISKLGKLPKAAKSHDDATADHVIVEAMVAATRTNKMVGTNDVIYDVEGTENERTNTEVGVVNQAMKRTGNVSKSQREAFVSVHGEETETKNYRRIKPKKKSGKNGSEVRMTNYEDEEFDAPINPSRTPFEHMMGRKKQLNRKGDYEGDLVMEEFGDLSRHSGKKPNSKSRMNIVSDLSIPFDGV